VQCRICSAVSFVIMDSEAYNIAKRELGKHLCFSTPFLHRRFFFFFFADVISETSALITEFPLDWQCLLV
jgi:hypothetical protein